MYLTLKEKKKNVSDFSLISGLIEMKMSKGVFCDCKLT